MIFSWRAGLPLPIPRLPSGSSQASVPISNAGTRTRLVHVDPSQHPEARRVLQPSPTKPKNKSAEPVFPIRASLPISISPSLTHRSSRLRTIPKVSSSSSIDAIQDVWPNKRKTTLPSSPLDCASWKRVRLTDTYPTPPASNRSSASLIELKAQSRRMSLQQQWSDLARNDRGAERVSFVNTVNDEAVPDGLEGFVYLEHSYRLPPQLGSVPCLDLESRELHPATPLTDRDRLVYCDCKPGCTNADQCTCQSNCEEAGYAYTDVSHDLAVTHAFLFDAGPVQFYLSQEPDRCGVQSLLLLPRDMSESRGSETPTHPDRDFPHRKAGLGCQDISAHPTWPCSGVVYRQTDTPFGSGDAG
ncbi:unnamed protein product [Mycena citricolor]|uniref:Uncharacterized protein n=1 Tax=Mycena citricolor TaxID=2018698 RepID=A0AAD2H3A5_9AGAR|nr:unnamed protein product [Mycena citricolor]